MITLAEISLELTEIGHGIKCGDDSYLTRQKLNDLKNRVDEK